MTWSPPTIPARLAGWEHAYASMVERLAATPFEWGAADCVARVLDLCEVMTGVNPLPASQRRYKTANGAALRLARLGFSDLDAALGSVFPAVPKARARRGDCGIGDVRIGGQSVEVAFIVMGANALASNERGPVVVQTMQLRKTFAIG